MSSSSDDSYDYLNYAIEFYEEEDGPPIIKKRSRLIAAVVHNQVEIVEELLDSAKWYRVKDKYGLNLLQISILRERKAVFDFLLSLKDFPLELEDHEGDTALVTSLCGFVSNDIWMEDYYAKQLIKRGADVNRVDFDNNPLIHCALERDFLEVVRLLIEHGADINAQNGDGKTALHMCFQCSDSYIHEAITMLLWYGADATVLDKGNSTAFDMVVTAKCDTWIQETLFYYIYDQDMRNQFSARVLLKLAKRESPLFDQVVDIAGEIIYDEYLENCCMIIFSMKTKYLRVLIENFDFVIKEILTNYCSNVTNSNRYKRISIENFEMLLESELKPEVLNFISEVHQNDFMQKLVESGMSEKHLTELVCFLLSYGMIIIHEVDFQTIYQMFGYCELFKILLHMDVKKLPCQNHVNDLMPYLIYNVRTDIEDVINNVEFYSFKDLKELLHYCAHPKLIQLGHTYPEYEEMLSESLKNMPRVPLLVELARNVFRRYFIQKFRITSTKQFYTLLKSLPIALNHKKIISYEIKLY